MHQTAEQSRIVRLFWHVFDTRVFALFLRKLPFAFTLAACVAIAGCATKQSSEKPIPPAFKDGKPLDLTEFTRP